MKRLFLLLVLANIALFAWEYGQGKVIKPNDAEIPAATLEPILLVRELPGTFPASLQETDRLFAEIFPIIANFKPDFKPDPARP